MACGISASEEGYKALGQVLAFGLHDEPAAVEALKQAGVLLPKDWRVRCWLAALRHWNLIRATADQAAANKEISALFIDQFNWAQ